MDIEQNLSVGDWQELRVIDGAEIHSSSVYLRASRAVVSARVSGRGSLLFADDFISLNGSVSQRLWPPLIPHIEHGGAVAAGVVNTSVFRESEIIRMATGGVLALRNGFDDPLLADIEFWSDGQWRPLDEATLGVDYTFTMPDSGPFAGYTVLTVGVFVPEPSAILIAFPMAAAWPRRVRVAGSGRQLCWVGSEALQPALGGRVYWGDQIPRTEASSR